MTKLEKVMFEKRVKDKDLYPMLGISASYFNEIKKGKVRMPSYVLMQLHEILKCDASEIYGDVEKTDAA